MKFLTILCLVLVLLVIFLTCCKSDHKRIYLDNNGTTFQYKEVSDAIYSAGELGNASGIYANDAKKIINDFKKEIVKLLNMGDLNSQARVIITSGGSESNNLIIRGCIDKWWMEKKSVPHVVISAVEHKTSILCCEQLLSEGRIELSLCPVNQDSTVDSKNVAELVRENTCFISIMQSNNETGALNDIKSIASELDLCRNRKNFIFHSDIVQMFGKIPIDFSDVSIDAVSISMHKLHGPTGVGVLALRGNCCILPQIHGVQNDFLRGGTENIPLIKGSLECLKKHFVNRDEKNKRLRNMISYIRNELSMKFDTKTVNEIWSEHLGMPDNQYDKTIRLIFLSPNPLITQTNTLLVSAVGNNVCNIEIRKKLLENSIIVSIGSTCNTNIKGSSHVLLAMNLPREIRKGVIRVSVSDFTTIEDCKKFVEVYEKIMKSL